MVCYNVENCLKAALLFTAALVATYGLNPVATSTQSMSDSLGSQSSANRGAPR